MVKKRLGNNIHVEYIYIDRNSLYRLNPMIIKKDLQIIKQYPLDGIESIPLNHHVVILLKREICQ